MERLAKAIVKFRVLVFCVIAGITLFFAYQIKNIKIDSDVTHYLPQNDPIIKLFNKIGNEFGANAIVMIALQSDNIFNPEVIKDISRMTEALTGIDGVMSVTSLTNIIDIRKTDDGIEVGKLIEPDEIENAKAEKLEYLKNYIFSKDLYDGLVSRDGTTTVIICKIQEDVDKPAVAHKIERVVRNLGIKEKVYFGGVLIQINELFKLIRQDLVKLLPIVIFIIVVILFLSFRSWYGVLIPLGSVGLSVVWVMGFMALINKPLTMVSDVIPVLLVAIGSAYSIHFISKFNESVSNDRKDVKKRVIDSLKKVGMPIFLSALTTIFGFLSFVFGSYLTAIKDFGLFTAFGVAVSFLITLFFVPAILSYILPKQRRSKGAARSEKFAENLSAGFLKHTKIVGLVFFLLVVLSVVGIFKVERTSNMINYFKAESPTRKIQRILDTKLGGAIPLQVYVRGDFHNPFVLQALWRFEKFLGALDNVHNPQSVAHFIAEMNYVIDNKKYIPPSEEKVSNLWFLLEGNEILPQFVNYDYTEGIIQAMVSVEDTRRMRNIVRAVDKYIRKLGTEWVVYDMEDIGTVEREKLKSYLKTRIVSEMLWDIESEAGTKEVNFWAMKDTIAKSVNTKSSFSENIKALVNVLPAKITNNKRIMTKLKGDLQEMYDNFVALPKKDARTLKLSAEPYDKLELSMSQNGMPIIYSKLDSNIFRSQYMSFAIALVLVYVLLFWQLGSGIGALISVFPIVVTVFVVGGIMGFAGISLDIATALIASVIIGMGIDYSIHFVNRYKLELSASKKQELALKTTLRTTGRAIYINAFSVGLGFLSLVFASLVPLQNFGLLVAVAMLISATSAVVLIPALILQWHYRVRNGKTKGNRHKNYD